MTTTALVFMALSWGFVLGLMGLSFRRILKPRRFPRLHETGE